MTLNDVENIFKFIGGLGMFLYGMNVMAEGLQKAAGDKMKKLLGFLTNNRFMAVLVGALVTAIIQSSSATTVMVVGFVNAGIMNLVQAVGVIMGANIGTTVTSWLVSMSEWGAFFKPEFLAPLIVGIGAFILLFAKGQKKKEFAHILIGFGVLFIGLGFMSASITVYKDAPIFSESFRVLGSNPILGILIGALVTAIIQSSSASVGILQTLAMNGMVSWNSAIYVTLGQNIGTCVTALISSAGAHKTAKRAAIIHLLFNVFGATLFGTVMFVFFTINKELASSTINSVEISIFHTVFNVVCTIIMFPFANLLVKLSGFIIHDTDDDEAIDELEETKRHLEDRILETPSFALESTLKEVAHMGQVTYDNTKLSFDAILNNDIDKSEEVLKTEQVIDSMAKLISDYLVKLSNLNLTEEQHTLVNNLFYTVSDIERMGDHAENLANLADYRIQNKINFSDAAMTELNGIMELVTNSFVYAIKARSEQSLENARKTLEYEEMVDSVEEELRAKHMERLSKELCTPTSGVVYLDILSNLERISDHAENIAGYIIDEA